MFKKAIACVMLMIPLRLLAAPAPAIVQVLDKTTGKHVCTGVFISNTRVLTARHCLSSAEAFKYFVVHPELKLNFDVKQVHFYENDSRYFPNRDLAVLDLVDGPGEKVRFPKLTAIPLVPGMRTLAYGRGYANAEMNTSTLGSLKKIDGRIIQNFDGFRVEGLTQYQTKGRDLCVGDSGGPLFVRAGTSEVLVGWINGLWDPITNEEGYCSSEVVVTRIAKYLPWIQDPKPRRQIRDSNQSLSSLEQACKDNTLSSDQHLLVQKILIQLVDQEKSQNKKWNWLLRCQDVNLAWQTFTGLGKTLVLDARADLTGLTFLHNLKGLELSNVSQVNIKDLDKFTQLETLTLNGSTQEINLAKFRAGFIKRLIIKNFRSLEGLKRFLAGHPEIEDITLLDIQNKEGPIRLSWFANIKSLKRLKIGMSPITEDMTLPASVSIRLL